MSDLRRVSGPIPAAKGYTNAYGLSWMITEQGTGITLSGSF